MASSWDILTSYLNEISSNHVVSFKLSAKTLLDRSPNNSFSSTLSYYQGILEGIDPVLFPYMVTTGHSNPSVIRKKEQLIHDLQITRILLAAQAAYEIRHQKNENVSAYLEQIDQCTLFLSNIEATEMTELQLSKKQKNYLQFALGQDLAEELMAIASHQSQSKTKKIENLMGAVNNKRLYWIWGSSLLKSVIAIFPSDFFNLQQAEKVICIPDPYTRCLSWLLYLSRFSMTFGLLLKHTLPWCLSEAEQQLPWTERFSIQWQQRKFSLLNDFLWGLANLFCAVWLTGSIALNIAGDVLTALLLVFDLAVSLWDYFEQKKHYLDEMECFEQQINTLKQMGSQLSGVQKSHLFNLQKAQSKLANNWQINSYDLYNNIAYAVGLLLAFIVLATFFMPLATTTAATVGLAGAILCFVFTVINNAGRGGIEIYKSGLDLKEFKINFNVQVDLFKEMLNTGTNLENAAQKFLFLEIKKLQANSAFQRDFISYQTLGLIHSVTCEMIIPAIIFASLVFLPLVLGLSALTGAFGLAIASHFLINSSWCKPDDEVKNLPEFNEMEYRDFCSLVKKEEKTSGIHYAFFQQKPPVSTANSSSVSNTI